MRSSRILLAVFAGFLLLPAPGPGQTALSLTVEECVRMGLENSRALHLDRSRTEAADAKVREASAARLPSVKAGLSYTRLSEVTPFVVTLPTTAFALSPSIPNNYGARFSLQQPLFTGYRLESGVEAARHLANATQEEYQRDASLLTYQIRSAYWGLFKAMEMKKVADENVRQMQVHLKDAQNLSNQGMLTTNEVLKVEVQLSNAQLLQIQSDNAVRLATVALDNQIGLPLETEVRPASGVAEESEGPEDLAALVSQAVENRSEPKALEARVKAGQAGVRLARSGRLPQVYLTGNWSYLRPNSRVFPLRDRFKGTWDMGIAASLDLWNWGMTDRQVDQARAQVSQAQDALAQLTDGIRLEVTQHHLSMVEAKERISVASQAVRQAEEGLRTTDERFKVGIATNSDLLDAEVALVQAKTTYTQTLVDCEVARAGLARVIGQ